VLAMIAAVTHTPLDVVWRFTPQQVMSYLETLPAIVPLFNAFAQSKKKDKPQTDLSRVAPELRRLGIMK
jgi:hypothetical protein